MPGRADGDGGTESGADFKGWKVTRRPSLPQRCQPEPSTHMVTNSSQEIRAHQGLWERRAGFRAGLGPFKAARVSVQRLRGQKRGVGWGWRAPSLCWEGRLDHPEEPVPEQETTLSSCQDFTQSWAGVVMGSTFLQTDNP